MKIPTNSIKEMVTDKVVEFVFFQHNQLWYRTECNFMFPVPIDDTGDGAFQRTDKAIYFMRYIRKHIQYLKDAQNEQATHGSWFIIEWCTWNTQIQEVPQTTVYKARS